MYICIPAGLKLQPLPPKVGTTSTLHYIWCHQGTVLNLGWPCGPYPEPGWSTHATKPSGLSSEAAPPLPSCLFCFLSLFPSSPSLCLCPVVLRAEAGLLPWALCCGSHSTASALRFAHRPLSLGQLPGPFGLFPELNLIFFCTSAVLLSEPSGAAGRRCGWGWSRG